MLENLVCVPVTLLYYDVTILKLCLLHQRCLYDNCTLLESGFSFRIEMTCICILIYLV